jgi:chemotaxis protein CheX
MDVKATNPSISGTLENEDCVYEAAVDVFRAACNLEIEPTEEEGNLSADGTIIGVISIVGDVEWSVFLGLPRATTDQLMKRFTGFEIPFDCEDIGDAVGELTNVLAGQVKKQLANRKVNAKISLPSVMRATSMEVLVQQGTSATKTCFDSEVGKFWTGVVALQETTMMA